MSGTHFPNRRRRPSLIRNFWVYRRLVAAALVMGLILWFVLTNNTAVEVYFPFGLGTVSSTTGMVILMSALFGSLATALVLTLFFTLRRSSPAKADTDPDAKPQPLTDELPPPDYAAKTPDGFTPSGWE